MTLPRKALYFVLAASFIGALAFLTWREPRQLAATGAVTQGPLQETFTEEAKTRLKQRYAIAAPVSGTLQRITLEPGDAVQEGQPVAYIAPAASTLLDDRSRAQAEADVKSGQSQQAAASQRIVAARAIRGDFDNIARVAHKDMIARNTALFFCQLRIVH